MADESVLAPLTGFRVIEIGDEKIEFVGRLLVGGGAEIVKVEPPGGSPTRQYGPFLDDSHNLDESLHFWHYNLGKKSLVLDLDTPEGVAGFRELVAGADVLLDGCGTDYLADRGLAYDDLSALDPRLVMCSITDFGRTGPWRDLKASELIHLALGGQMMVCGYRPSGDFDPMEPEPSYDAPPIAPQMWHPYHTVGVSAATAVYAALFWREMSGEGQFIDANIHNALAACTELPVPFWIYNHQPVYRQTGSHAMPQIGSKWQLQAGDDNWVYTMSAIGGFSDTWSRFVKLLEADGIAGEMTDPKYNDVAVRRTPEVTTRVLELTETFVALHTADEAMHAGQSAGLAWAAIRRPEDNVADRHFQERQVFQPIEHPEHGRSFTYVALPWICEEMPWQIGQRAPLLGEHNGEFAGQSTAG